MKEIRKKIESVYDEKINDQTSSQFMQLTSFIDASISEGFSKSEDEKSQFLIRQLMQIRDYLTRAVHENGIRQILLKEVQNIFDAIEKQQEEPKKNEKQD